jgi:DNA repair exonuclease SbcCD ATPase subunit
MAIEFTTIKWKNFLSTGDAYTEIDLQQTKTSLIVGENGSGKSTLLDAICFGLFGKPYRNINKPQLVNSINGKNCIVDISFKIGKTSYRVIRGIKPTLFEIWVNDKIINQDTSSRDYQRYLEEVILKLNFKSFTQIVIVGSASFTPFMQLPAAARREVIEDLLDIKIFSGMNTVLKTKQNELNSDMVRLDSERDQIKTRAQMQDKLIKSLTDSKVNRETRLQKKRVELVAEVTNIRDGIEETEELLRFTERQINHEPDLEETHRNRDIQIHQYKSEIARIKKNADFFANTVTCPKCLQAIQESLRDQTVQSAETDVERLEVLIAQEQQAYDAETLRIRENQKLDGKIRGLDRDLHNLKSNLKSTLRMIDDIDTELQTIDKETVNIDEERDKLKAIAKEGVEVEAKRAKLNLNKRHYEIVGIMLKDSGIKTKIVKTYLPIINKIVNKYLASMDFFVQFNLDEKFNEVIKSRHRDDFTYASFSEGEKQRISLALLFTWRDVARLKNTANTNLLILDEVFDSSLDQRATEQVMELLTSLGDKTNLFVISHKSDQLINKFDRVMRFEKKKNFSVLT